MEHVIKNGAATDNKSHQPLSSRLQQQQQQQHKHVIKNGAATDNKSHQPLSSRLQQQQQQQQHKPIIICFLMPVLS